MQSSAIELTAKKSSYGVDGTGRDSYIKFNNGGNFRGHVQEGRGKFERGLFPATGRGRINSDYTRIEGRPLHYIGDGTGRDVYIMYGNEHSAATREGSPRGTRADPTFWPPSATPSGAPSSNQATSTRAPRCSGAAACPPTSATSNATSTADSRSTRNTTTSTPRCGALSGTRSGRDCDPIMSILTIHRGISGDRGGWWATEGRI